MFGGLQEQFDPDMYQGVLTPQSIQPCKTLAVLDQDSLVRVGGIQRRSDWENIAVQFFPSPPIHPGSRR